MAANQLDQLKSEPSSPTTVCVPTTELEREDLLDGVKSSGFLVMPTPEGRRLVWFTDSNLGGDYLFTFVNGHQKPDNWMSDNSFSPAVIQRRLRAQELAQEYAAVDDQLSRAIKFIEDVDVGDATDAERVAADLIALGKSATGGDVKLMRDMTTLRSFEACGQNYMLIATLMEVRQPDDGQQDPSVPQLEAGPKG